MVADSLAPVANPLSLEEAAEDLAHQPVPQQRLRQDEQLLSDLKLGLGEEAQRFLEYNPGVEFSGNIDDVDEE